ncbi:glycoside hydrolase domain-containing protein [Limibacterium fermenti]|jgi:hypothetical protein|uniref:DUF4091 domain-containing protein n=1 Tax=Limibacterium fermenti TaxID=3229863 RepID=UPI000E9D1865|nr:hypothetical protein [Porphyromonadaceae bacterium]HBX47137.1 hypothetical protein [Porphyromonadaceae bacterium]HCM21205.1 hypothetical protein [Porphyromonadaceae bacterium]
MIKKFSLLFFFFTCLILGGFSINKEVYLYQVDPLKKVLKEQAYFRDVVDTVRVARGETASVQIVVKGLVGIENMRARVIDVSSVSSKLTGTTGWVGYVHVGRSYNPPSKDIIRSASGYFPDPILPDSAFSIEQGEVQPLWVSVPTTASTSPGLYKGQVEITGKIGKENKRWRKDFYIRVYPVTLQKSPLLITNWSAHFSPITLSYLNNNKTVEAYSPLYWELIELHADIMAAHRQNVHRIYPVWHTLYTYKEGKYTFDFTRFDQEAGIFDKVGALERIEGGHLAWRSGAWNDPFFVEVPLPDNEETRKLKASPNPKKVENGIRFALLPVDDERAKNFLTQFLPALKEHLEKKGWLNRYMQHIADEPTAKNASSYVTISNYIHQFLPGVKVIDAVLTSKELAGAIDIWVPVLDVFHKDFNFYQDLKKQGKEIWFYTCVGPRGNYANRFIELPLNQTRYLHWINYKYDATGYLHWGLNYWEKDQLYADASRDRGRLPAGDNCIIYPGYRKLYTSIRFETMRDGIDDYQLLKMVEKKDPVKAKGFVDSIILNFNEYDESIAFFRKIRKEMLEFLSI